MGFEIHFRVEHNKLLLQTFLVWAHEVVVPEVLLTRIIVDVVLLLSPAISTDTTVTALLLVSTMCVQLVVSVEALATEPTLGVSLKTTLIDCARIVVAKFLVLSQLSKGKELVLVRKDFLVSGTKITCLGQQLPGRHWTSGYCS